MPSEEALAEARELTTDRWKIDKFYPTVSTTDRAALDRFIAEAIDRAKREERESCARLADDYTLEHSRPDKAFQDAFQIGCDDMSLAIAAAIRARETS